MIGANRSVAIIGGGIAGMSAAFALREQFPDLAITLFEARRATGGRAGSFIDSMSGDQVDYCQHVAMGCCTNLLAMMKQAGIDDAFTRFESLTFHHPKFPAVRFEKSSLLPAPMHLLPSLLRMPYLSWRQRFDVGRATFKLMRLRENSLKNTTALNWLTSNGQSAATIRDYWDVVIASALGESSERVSMAATRKVFIDGFLAHRDASDVLVPRLPLSELFGERLPGALKAVGVDVRSGTAVQSLAIDDQSKASLGVKGATIAFDHVIVAVPYFALNKIIDENTARRAGLPLDRYAGVASSPISGIHLWFDQPVIEAPHAVLVNSLAQWLFRRESDTAGTGLHYVQVVVSASHALRLRDSEQVIEQVVGEIKHAFPQSSRATLVRGRVVTDPQSVFSITPEVDAMRPTSHTALPCLHLAGDFVQTGWPATMEGATISGRMAASSVAEQLGGTPVVVDSGLPRNLLCRMLVR